MTQDPTESEADEAEQLRVLQQLRTQPELFAAISACTPAELISQKTLRSRFDLRLVPPALALHEARERAVGRLPDARQLWLTRTGLEQSTAPEIARHKARRFASADHVTDLCCGLGVDASALAEVTRVTAIDASPTMATRALWNAEVWGTSSRLQTRPGDVSQQSWAGHLVHADPDRRDGRDRPSKRLEQYRPDLTWMQQLVTTAAGGALKISPASNFQQKFPGCEIELISLGGECREATVWFGSLAGPHTFRATNLTTGETLSEDPLSAWTNVTPQPGALLLDPDPAIVRSGLLDVMAERLELLRLDQEEEYLTGDVQPRTGFVSCFQVQTILSANVKELRRYLRERPAREYEIKCRRIATDAQAIRRQLPTGDGPPLVILFCRIAGRSHIVVASRLPPLAPCPPTSLNWEGP